MLVSADDAEACVELEHEAWQGGLGGAIMDFSPLVWIYLENCDA